ncbi:MAG: NAD(P)H-quinone oxidoreductase [Porticoccaceae bacterium]|jgi:putative PIG3 family NAD(P)H quinone oxidoreductase|nr:NAD(P)H-quinone oxidoreductase [Porticoccaceae bacterium]MEA3299039.1 NAD(P)H-quinone oxidoreductase [Pseudomonadota bacterium]HLS98532.1 NAD(P)H-quinone oxidoreductase [Porticoccaceae bacterium]
MAGHYRIIQAAAGNRRQGPVIAYTANPLNTPVAMPLPTHTDCIEISAPGGAGMLRPTRRPLPAPGPEEVVIAVHSAGVNRPDVIQRQGLYPPPPGVTDIPGLEVSGTVIALGAGVSRWAVGDAVCALLAGGGYSRHALAHQDLCLPVPPGIGLAEAAALPETAFTVWFNLVQQGGLRAGDRVLIHGGASGIGTLAIQVARALGATVYATAGSDDKCRSCERLGAEKCFNYRREDFTDLKALTGGRGADIILDMVGGDYVARNIRVAARRGRIISLAFLKGSRVEVDLMPMMLKQLVLTGSTLRSQPLAVKAAIARAVGEGLWPLVTAGQVRPVIHRTLPLVEAAEAHRIMESSTHTGKLLLDCRA